MRAIRTLVLATTAWTVLALGACGEPAPITGEGLLVRVTLGVNEIEFGRSFPITVVRSWDKDLEPEAWRDELLAPFTVELVETNRREDGHRVEEVRRYTGRAFTLDDVIVPPITVRATALGGGDDHVFTTDGPALRVRPSVDRSAPGSPEWPSGLLSERPPWGLVIAGGLAALALMVFLIRRARLNRLLAPPEPAIAPVPIAHGAIALGRIEGLRERRPTSPEEIVSFHVEAADLLRAYVAGRTDVDLEPRTTEEITAAEPVETTFGHKWVDALAGFLAECDCVKFGGVLPGPDACDALIGSADAFVRATRSGETHP